MDRSTNDGNKNNDVLHLNIGGQSITAVQRRLLTSVEGSLLATIFSGRWDESTAKDKDGNFFIDFPSDLILPMIDYLRLKSIETSKHKVLSPTVQKFGGDCDRYEDFIRLMDYFGMTHAVFPTKIRPVISPCTYPTIQPCHSHLFHVVASEVSSFALIPHGHDLKIKAFEVTIGDVETFTIGWLVRSYSPHNQMLTSKLAENSQISSCNNQYYDSRCPFGVRINGTALEVSQDGNCQLFTYSATNYSEKKDIPGLVPKGAVIRCEYEPPAARWLVNENEVKCVRDWQTDTGSITPTFAGRGEWWVSNIELGHRHLDFSEQVSADAIIGSAIFCKP
jgi:hypothetical protein